MAEDVGNLRVRLSMNSADFDRSIASMNRTLRAMGQEIRGLQNRGREWGSSIDGLRTKQEAYGRLLEAQKTKVRRLNEEYERAKREQGENATATQRLAEQLNRANAEMTRTERELNDINNELRRQEEELARSRTAWARFGESAQAVGAKLKAVGDSMMAVGRTLSMSLTAPIAALTTGALKAAIDFESSFAGVRKTIDTSEAGFKKLEKGILEMARTLPASASEIAGVAESAGQLGIAEDNVLSFTRTIIDLGESTNLSLDQAASEFARFANITGMSQNDFSRLGSSVVALGNSMATTEAEIVSMAMRLAAQGKQVGMTEAEIMALSGTMSSLGIQAEAGGTAMTTILKKIQTATGEGGKSLDAFAKAAGMSSSEFKAAFEKDAVGALDLLVKGLAKSGESGENLTKILETLGITGVYESDVLLRMAGASDLLSAAVDTSSQAWSENTALADEAAQRYATTASQLAMLKNKVIEIGIAFGQVLIPMMMSVVDTITPMVERFATLEDKTKKIIIVIGAIAAAIGPVILVVGALVSSIGTIISALGVASSAIAAAGGAMSALSTAFAVITGPIALAIAAVAAVGVALVAAYKNIDGFKTIVDTAFNAALNTIKSVMTTIQSFITDVWRKITSFWRENGDQIKQATDNVFSAIKAVIEVVMPVIQGIIKVAMIVIKSVIEQVWTAIKGVIEGTLDVILGLIKTFSSLFTGDWQGMWDGVKTLVSGAVTAIWNTMQLMFFGKLLTGLGAFVGSFKTVITGMWSTVKSLFTSSTSAVSNVTSAAFNAIKSVVNVSMSSVKSVVTSIWSAVKSVFTGTINAIKNTVSTGFTTVVNTVKTAMSNTVSAVTGTASKMLSAGKDLVRGLVDGILSMGAAAVDAITGVVDGVIGKAKSLLKIASPSKVFTQFGGWISEGLANGITKSADLVVTSTKNLINNGILTPVKDLSQEILKEFDLNLNQGMIAAQQAAGIKLAGTVTDNHLRVRTALSLAQGQERGLRRDAQEVLQRDEDEHARRMKQLWATYEHEQKAGLNTTTKEYIEYVDRMAQERFKDVRNQLEAGTIGLEATKRYYDQAIAAGKEYIAEQKSQNAITLREELAFWEDMMAYMMPASQSYQEVLVMHQASVKAIRDDLEKKNKEHVDKMLAIDKELADETAKLSKEYDDAYNSRIQTLSGFAKTFDEFKAKTEITGQQLMDNLQSQVTALDDYGAVWGELSGRIKDADLLDELKKLGPASLGELQALNSLTSEQLDQYVAMYRDKFDKASAIAADELQPLRDNIDEQIAIAEASAIEKLDNLNKEWQMSITGIVDDTATNLDSLEQVGRDAAQGLHDGLASMQSTLVARATTIADGIKVAMQTALDIHSPSRVMRGFGVNIGEGLVLGMGDMLDSVAKASARLSNAVVGAQTAMQYSEMSSMGAMSNAYSNTSTIDNSKTFAPTINLNGQGNVMDAERALRRMAFAF